MDIRSSDPYMKLQIKCVSLPKMIQYCRNTLPSTFFAGEVGLNTKAHTAAKLTETSVESQ